MSRSKKNNKTEKKQKNSTKSGKPPLIMIMITTAFIWAGGVYFYDFPQLFEEILIRKFKIDTLGVSLLYSMASAPTIVLVPLASWLISHVGLNSGAVIFNSTLFTGVFICFLGVYYENFIVLVVGRGIFGVGYEMCYVIQASCTEKWFSGRFLTMAFAVNRIASYSLSSLGAYFEPMIFEKSRNLGTPLFVYSVVMAASCFNAFAYFLLDHKHEHKLISKDEEDKKDEKFKLSDLKKVSLQAWLMLIVFGVLSNCLYQFTNIGTDCLVNRFGFDYLEAKNMIALIPIVNMIAIPVFSSVISVIGKKGIFLSASALIVILNYGFLASLGQNKNNKVVIGVFGVGVYYSLLTSSFWSSFSLMLPKKTVPVVFGICISIQSIFLAGFPPIFSYFDKERDYKAYQNCLYLLVAMGAFCFLITVVITIRDIKGSKVMHLPENDKRVAEFRELLNQDFEGNEEHVSDMYDSMMSVSTYSEGKSFEDDDLDI